MSMILSWVLFPLVLAALGLGWGSLVGWAAGGRDLGALVIPLGLAAALVVAALLTIIAATAPAAAPVAAAGGLIGLARAWRRTRIHPAALVAAAGVLLIYGAPVILSGEATFLGYVRLDDTATWLGFIDQFFAHGRDLSSLDPSSTYELLLAGNLIVSGYPSGAFMLAGVGHWITGIDAAWIFQPYMAACAGALALCCFELIAPVVKSAWLRAFVAFIAAQSALLFGYAAWGGIKELTAAFLLALCVVLGARLITGEDRGPRASIPIAVATAALIVTLGAGAAIYIAPLALVGYTVFVWRGTQQVAWGGGTRRWLPLAVLGWDLVAAANAALAGLAFAVIPKAVLGFVSPAHTQDAGVALIALDYVVSQWLPGTPRPLQLARRALGAGVVAIVVVLILVLGAGATPWITLGGLVALVVLATPSLDRAASFFAGAGAPALALPLGAVLALPTWLELSPYLTANDIFTNSGAGTATAYGNLTKALRAMQLGGIWLAGDFRSFPTPPSPGWVNYLLIWLVIAGALFALAWTLRRGSGGVALYVAIALLSLSFLSVEGTVPWLMGKSMAFSSPAVLLAGLAGGAILFSLERRIGVIIGVILLGAIAGGVLWSNYLQYRNVTLAPRPRLSELQKIGTMLDGKGPTFFNEYEIYGDRHFLRAGEPVEPAEYRPVDLPTLGNALLTDAAWGDLDSFALATFAPYRSLVVRVGPTESEPSTLYGYSPVWQGRYYQLWQQPAHPRTRVIAHVPLGDSSTDPYCGRASNAADIPDCPIAPAAVPSCTQVHALARSAADADGELVAYERTNPIVARTTQLQYVGTDWYAAPGEIAPVGSGAKATWRLELPHAIAGYQLWLGGSFQRGFTVTVDGRRIGSVADALDPVGAYERVGAPLRLAAGAHTITVASPGVNLSPGNADSEPYYTELSAIALSPPASTARYLTESPARASSLCGRSLDWIEVVAPS
jgi:hypothetical protein